MLVGDDPVDLLGHRAVEAAQARLDVRDGDLQLGRDERAASVELTSPTTITRSDARLDQNRLESLHHPRGLLGVAPRADLQHWSGAGMPSSSKKTWDICGRSAGRCGRSRGARREPRPQGGDHGGAPADKSRASPPGDGVGL